jgi:hypothetical protein
MAKGRGESGKNKKRKWWKMEKWGKMKCQGGKGEEKSAMLQRDEPELTDGVHPRPRTACISE